MSSRKVPFALLVAFAFLTSQISAAYVLFGLLTLAWGLALRREGRLPESLRSAFTFLVGLLGLFTLLSAVFSRDPWVSFRHVPGLTLLALVPITMDLVDTAPRGKAIFLAISAAGVALGLYGIWQFLHGGNDLDNRIRGTLSHYMTFSGLTMIAACLLLAFALEERGPWRLVGLLCVIPFAAVLLTYTRGAYVGILAALLVFVTVRRPRGLWLLAAVLAAVFFLTPPEIRDRIRSITNLSDRTNRDRIAMSRAGLRIVEDYPIFGLGPDMVQPYYPLYRDADAPRWRVPHLHDNALQIAAGNGLFAAAAYLAMLALFFARTVALLRHEERPERAALWAGALIAGVALTVAGLFEYNFGDTEVEMATLLVFGVPFSKAARAPARLESR